MVREQAMPRADAIHLGLMLLALAVAYVLPFELLLLSYAILGPVHYLTEISWLHDRKYFLAVTSPRPAFAFVALMAVLTVAAVAVPSIPVSGLLIWAALVAGGRGAGAGAPRPPRPRPPAAGGFHPRR